MLIAFLILHVSEFHRGQSQVLQGDMFLPAMRDFQAQATCRLAEAEDLFQDMKTRVKIPFSIIISIVRSVELYNTIVSEIV